MVIVERSPVALYVGPMLGQHGVFAGEVPPLLTLVLLNCLLPLLIHPKLELITQFPASNDGKDLYL